MKRSPNNNLAAKSQKRPRRLLDKAQSNTTPPPLLNLAADALVRAGGKSSTMKNLNYPNKLVNIVDKFERQKAIRDIGPHVRRHLNRYFSGNDKDDRGTLSLEEELMKYSPVDKGYMENVIKTSLKNSLLKLDSKNYTPNEKKRILESIKRKLGIHMARTAAIFPRNRLPRSVVNVLHPLLPNTQYSFSGGRYPYPNEKKMVKAYRRARQLKTEELGNFLKKLKNRTIIPQDVIKLLGEKMRKNTTSDALVRASGKSSTMKNLNYPYKLIDKFKRQKAIRDIGPHVRRHLNRYFSGNDKADRGTLSLEKELMGYSADKGYMENVMKKYLQKSVLKLDSNNYTPNEKKRILESVKRDLGIHMARTAALFPRNRAVPRSVVNALHPTRRNNNNSAPYTQYSFGGRYPYPNEKKMVKAYRRARQLKTDELGNFLKMLKNRSRKSNILGIRNYNEEKFFEMFKNKSIPQNVIKFLGEKMRKNTS